MAGKLKITLKKSTIRTTQPVKETVRSLGLRKLNQTVEHNDTPDIRGMCRRVQHLIVVEEI